MTLTPRRALALAVLLALPVSACDSGRTPATPPSSSPPTTTTTRPPQPAQYLQALRDSGMPVSRTGDSEELIGQGVCQQIAKGRDPGELTVELAAMGGTMTAEGAATIVGAAQQYLC